MFGGAGVSGIKNGMGKSVGQYQMYKPGTTTVCTYTDARLLQKFVTAIKDEDVKTIKKMTKKGINPDLDLRFEGGMEKMTALHFAASQGLVLATRELLQCKFDVNKATPFDLSTPLHIACQIPNGDAAAVIARDLLMHGANPNLTDHSGRTPLYVSVQMGRPDLVRILLRYGGDSSIVCEQEEIPDVIQNMTQHMESTDSELSDPYQGNTPLIQACREHHHDIIRELLKTDCDLNYSNTAGNTALHVAAKSESRSTYLERKSARFPLTGHQTILELLLDAGCDLNLMNVQGDTPIKRAADGVSEIFSWSFQIEDKIAQAMIFCDIITTLAVAGSNLQFLYDDESILSVLLHAYTPVIRADSRALLTKYTTACLYLLSGGVQPTESDLTKLTTLTRDSRPLADALVDAAQIPGSLKRLCKLSLRRHMRHPVRKNIGRLPLPKSLKGFVSLETNL